MAKLTIKQEKDKAILSLKITQLNYESTILDAEQRREYNKIYWDGCKNKAKSDKVKRLKRERDQALAKILDREYIPLMTSKEKKAMEEKARVEVR